MFTIRMHVVCNSKSIFILRDGDCMIETHVYNVTVNFTVKVVVANCDVIVAY